MAFTLKTSKTVTEQPAEASAANTAGSAQAEASSFSGLGSKPASNTQKPSFLKTGAQAANAMHKAEAEAKARKESSGKAFRFWIKPNEDANLTFLDGQLDKETGILNIPYANEHRLKVDNKWQDFLCTEDNEPCPLCAAGERKTFVGYLSVIDHRPREYEKDGKTVQVPHTRRLFVAKTETLKQLTKMAEKRENGLAGTTFEVSRTGDKKPQVGDLFDEIAKHDLNEVLEHFGEEGKALDYANELPYLTAAELSELGIGKKVSTIGSNSFASSNKSQGGATADAVDDTKAPW